MSLLEFDEGDLKEAIRRSMEDLDVPRPQTPAPQGLGLVGARLDGMYKFLPVFRVSRRVTPPILSPGWSPVTLNYWEAGVYQHTTPGTSNQAETDFRVT